MDSIYQFKNEVSNSNSLIELEFNKQQDLLKNSIWYHNVTGRIEAENRLLNNGEFLVRLSEKMGNKDEKSFVVTTKWNGKFIHTVIETDIDCDTNQLLYFINEKFKFPSILELITFHKENQYPLSETSEAVLYRPVDVLWTRAVTDVNGFPRRPESIQSTSNTLINSESTKHFRKSTNIFRRHKDKLSSNPSRPIITRCGSETYLTSCTVSRETFNEDSSPLKEAVDTSKLTSTIFKTAIVPSLNKSMTDLNRVSDWWWSSCDEKSLKSHKKPPIFSFKATFGNHNNSPGFATSTIINTRASLTNGIENDSTIKRKKRKSLGFLTSGYNKSKVSGVDDVTHENNENVYVDMTVPRASRSRNVDNYEESRLTRPPHCPQSVSVTKHRSSSLFGLNLAIISRKSKRKSKKKTDGKQEEEGRWNETGKGIGAKDDEKSIYVMGNRSSGNRNSGLNSYSDPEHDRGFLTVSSASLTASSDGLDESSDHDSIDTVTANTPVPTNVTITKKLDSCSSSFIENGTADFKTHKVTAETMNSNSIISTNFSDATNDCGENNKRRTEEHLSLLKPSSSTKFPSNHVFVNKFDVYGLESVDWIDQDFQSDDDTPTSTVLAQKFRSLGLPSFIDFCLVSHRLSFPCSPMEQNQTFDMDLISFVTTQLLDNSDNYLLFCKHLTFEFYRICHAVRSNFDIQWNVGYRWTLLRGSNLFQRDLSIRQTVLTHFIMATVVSTDVEDTRVGIILFWIECAYCLLTEMRDMFHFRALFCALFSDHILSLRVWKRIYRQDPLAQQRMELFKEAIENKCLLRTDIDRCIPDLVNLWNVFCSSVDDDRLEGLWKMASDVFLWSFQAFDDRRTWLMIIMQRLNYISEISFFREVVQTETLLCIIFGKSSIHPQDMTLLLIKVSDCIHSMVQLANKSFC